MKLLRPSGCLILISLLLTVACGQNRGDNAPTTSTPVPIPPPYTALTNPLLAEAAVLTHGAELYTLYCATCHGDTGQGDGPGAVNLNPQPAPLAQTGQRVSDAYLFWRISDGGQVEPFNSAMPPWRFSLSESDRWSLVHYLRSLGM